MKRILAIFLALILLTTNIGLAMATHYCGGEAVKTQLMLGHGHLDCDMSGMDMGAENTEKGPKAKNCCENQYQTFEIDGDYHPGFAQLIFNLDFVVALVHTFLSIAPVPETEKSPYAHYSPPLLLRDIPVLNQVFLI